jgi:hypothetical protein
MLSFNVNVLGTSLYTFKFYKLCLDLFFILNSLTFLLTCCSNVNLNCFNTNKKKMHSKNLPLLPTPGAPRTASFTSESEDFFRLTCRMPLMPPDPLMIALNLIRRVYRNHCCRSHQSSDHSKLFTIAF